MWFPLVLYRDDAKQRSNHKPQAFFLLQKRVRSRLAVVSTASLRKVIHLISRGRYLGRRQLSYNPNLPQLKMQEIFFLLTSCKPCGRWLRIAGEEIKGGYWMSEKVQSTEMKITRCLGRTNRMRKTLKRPEVFSMERWTGGENTTYFIGEYKDSQTRDIFSDERLDVRTWGHFTAYEGNIF